MTDARLLLTRLYSGKHRTPLLLLLLVILWPLSLLYRFAVAVRNFGYSHGMFKIQRLSCPVISIGNLTTGGTGKTPVTMLIAERLRHKKTTAILSRGYQSGNEHKCVVLRGSDIANPDVSIVGDEIALMASQLPDAWFGVGTNRIASALKLQESQIIQAIVLDDGFQHRCIARDCDIVLVDASNPFGNGMSLPAGPMRERITSLRRSHAVVITRCESVDELAVAELTARTSRYIDEARIFRAETVIKAIRAINRKSELAITDRRVWLFSGIGNPNAFENAVAATGARICGHTVFPDHHRYSENEIETLNRILSDNQAEYLLTTAKDAVKLAAYNLDKSRYGVVEIGIDFVDRADIFWGIIARSVGAEI